MTRFFALMTLAAALAPADTYFFGFLKSAPNRPTLPKEEASRLQAAHLAHLTAMAEEGALVAAGPFANGGAHRGVIIYKTATLEEAQRRADADPAVKAGLLVAELFGWTGPAGIGEEYMRRHRAANGKPDVKMVKHTLMLAKPGHVAKGALMSGPYAGGVIHVFGEMSAAERQQLEGPHVTLLLDWYVAEGVVPARP